MSMCHWGLASGVDFGDGQLYRAEEGLSLSKVTCVEESRKPLSY